MSFITHAQNFEDVLLWRALRDATPGFYVDVGANDPVEHSVTKSFYDAGWRGINIEPLPVFHAAFLAQRPEDINLAVAAGASEGEIVLYDVPAVNGWASSAPEVAAAHRAEGYELTELNVPLRTLNAIFQEHVTGDVHFLKIDVEGFEREVLLGLDLRRWRPWILVVEATMPNSRETNHETWQDLVTVHDYDFAYFDGLNRYYVAREHRALMKRLEVQANVFDDFIPSHLANAWRDNADLRALAAQAEQRLAENEAMRLALAEQVRAAGDRERLADEQRVALQALLSERITELQASFDHANDLRVLLEAAQARNANDGAALNAALAHADELQIQLRTFVSKNDLLESQGKALAAELESTAVRVTELEARLQAALDWRNDLDEQLREANERRNDLDKQLGEANAWGNNLDNQLREANAWGNDLDHQLREANSWGNDLAVRLHSIHQSTSWRISKPVRQVGSVYRRLTGATPFLPQSEQGHAMSVLKRSALQRLRTVATLPPVRKYVMPKLLRIPGVEQRLMRMAVSLRETAPAAMLEPAPLPPGSPDLSPRARQALSDLERARRRASNS